MARGNQLNGLTLRQAQMLKNGLHHIPQARLSADDLEDKNYLIGQLEDIIKLMEGLK